MFGMRCYQCSYVLVVVLCYFLRETATFSLFASTPTTAASASAETVNFYAINGFQNNDLQQYAINYCVTTGLGAVYCDRTPYLSFGQRVLISIPNAGSQISYLIVNLISSANPTLVISSYAYPNNITDYNFFLAIYTTSFAVSATNQITTNQPGVEGYGGGLHLQNEVYVGYYDLYYNSSGFSKDRVTIPAYNFYDLSTGQFLYSTTSASYELSFNQFYSLTFSPPEGNDGEIYLLDGVVPTTWCVASGNCQVQNAAVYCQSNQMYANVLVGNSYFNQLVIVSLYAPNNVPTALPTMAPIESNSNGVATSQLNSGPAAGVALAVIAAVAIIACYCYYRNKRRSSRLLAEEYSHIEGSKDFNGI